VFINPFGIESNAMSVSKEIQKKALTATSDVNAGAHDLNVIYSLPDFLDGQLVVVQFRLEKEGKTFENHVYISKNRVRVAKNQSQFAHLVLEEAKRPSVLSEWLNAGGVAGAIAVIVTVTICYMLAFRGDKDVPVVLSTSLATILGFYFGTKASHRGAAR
jgi:hypothetical protein